MEQSDKKKSWYNHAIFYEIYPLSFKDSKGDGEGDLEGLISKLDYLQWLGITAIWLCPITVSSMRDYGYDVCDYKNIDPRFGTLETFKKLTTEMHKRGMYLVMDFVINHTSHKHPWFIESKSSLHNPKRDWYIWRDGKDGKHPNNWKNISMGDSAWTHDPHTNQYYFHQFLKEQPDLNWRNEEVKSAMKDIMEFWIAHGVDGFRIDAILHVIEAEHLKDEPLLSNFSKHPFNHNHYYEMDHIYTRDQPELAQVLEFLSDIAKSHGEILLLSEAYGSPERLAEFYKYTPHGNQAPINFSLVDESWSVKKYREHINSFESALAKDDTRIYTLGTHDVPRAASRVGPVNARVMALLLMTLPGSPFIYYGDELGMTNTTIKTRDTRDHFAAIGSFIRDQVRTPMQWDSSEHAGFTSGTPWLPVNSNKKHINVEDEKSDTNSTLHLYRNLIKIRKDIPTLVYGQYYPYNDSHPQILSYERRLDDSTLRIYLNFTSKLLTIDIPQNSTLLFSTHNKNNKTSATLEPHEGIIIKIS